MTGCEHGDSHGNHSPASAVGVKWFESQPPSDGHLNTMNNDVMMTSPISDTDVMINIIMMANTHEPCSTLKSVEKIFLASCSSSVRSM